MLQTLYDLSDMGTVAKVIDSRAFSESCGVDSSNQVPGRDTLGQFRHTLEKGTIVDATIIKATSSTENKKQELRPAETDSRIAYAICSGKTDPIWQTLLGSLMKYSLRQQSAAIHRSASKDGSIRLLACIYKCRHFISPIVRNIDHFK